MHVLEHERLLVQLRLLAGALEFPGRDIGKIGVVAFGFVPSAGNVTITLVASTLTAEQTAQTWGVSLMRRSFITSIR